MSGQPCASPSPALISLRAVSKRYGETYAIREVSLEVPRGQLVAVVGGSGSGKTTTLKAINRLVEPEEGVVAVDGRDVRQVPVVQLRRGIGYVFQGIGLFPHLTVGENIAAVPRLLGWKAGETAARVAELLALMGLPSNYAARTPSALSGGERQRVGVARALAARPAIMLMDEPFGALDPVTRDHLAQAYRDLHQRLELTTVMVTHDVQEAVLLADRVVVMEAGRVIADDSPRVLLTGNGPSAALMQTPRRQAERIAGMLAGD